MVITGIKVPSDPHLRRWMMFIDGENFTIRGQQFAEGNSFNLKEGPWFMRDTFLWFPNRPGTLTVTNTESAPLQVQPHAIRAFYYTSLVGDDNKMRQVRKALHEMGFAPQVFKKADKNKKSKGVDIALATDLLSNAYNDNFEVAVLVAGDGDYIPLISEVKRLGKVVYLVFFLDSTLAIQESNLCRPGKNGQAPSGNSVKSSAEVDTTKLLSLPCPCHQTLIWLPFSCYLVAGKMAKVE